MDVNTLSIIIYVLVPMLTAVLGGWVGAYFGNKYRKDKESHEKEIVRFCFTVRFLMIGTSGFSPAKLRIHFAIPLLLTGIISAMRR